MSAASATQSRQNSLPSTSCITRHDSLCSSASSSRTRAAPSGTSRAHSASSAARRSSPTSPVPTRTSRCTRFLTTLPSGTRWKNSGGRTGGINACERRTLLLRRQRAIEIAPGGKPLRGRRYDVPQHLAPETSDALGFCAVEGDLNLLDRRHPSTIEARAFLSPARHGRHGESSPGDGPVGAEEATGRPVRPCRCVPYRHRRALCRIQDTPMAVEIRGTEPGIDRVHRGCRPRATPSRTARSASSPRSSTARTPPTAASPPAQTSDPTPRRAIPPRSTH